jgi:hypothetical protein
MKVIVAFVESVVPDTGHETGDLDERVIHRRCRLQHTLLARATHAAKTSLRGISRHDA